MKIGISTVNGIAGNVDNMSRQGNMAGGKRGRRVMS